MKGKIFKPLKNILRGPYRFIKSILGRSLSSDLSNFEYNREHWNRYAKNWNKTKIHVDNPNISEEEKKSYIKCLGDEWGIVSDVEKIVEEYIYPYVTKDSIVGEIGVGGGRIASKVIDRSKEFYCFEVSSVMLKRCKAALANRSHVRYVLLDQPRFPDRFIGKFDFIYSFDVFVHLDLHTMWKYFQEIRKILKEGGKAFIHTTNLKTPAGWEKFSKQKAYSFITHYFVSPEIIDILAHHSNLRIIKTSTVDPTNLYLNRDYMVVLEK